ncbi:Crp/Fnr family transcriptional regulator [Asanoa sp. NPDC049573]|uniref:Crp/Fnr family transcriptional regulator n=1 Tax=Asanoa sp. NPDC049573 TaxID=3155396 RepID=UPI00344964EE
MINHKPWRTTFWESLSAESRDGLTRLGYLQTFPPNSLLMRQNEPASVVMILLRGCVKIVAHLPNGYEAILALRDPGDLIGELGSIDQLPRSANVQAVIGAETLTLPVERFTTYVERHRDVRLVVQRCLIARLREADWQRTSAVSSPLPARLADLLLDLGNRYGEERDGDQVEIALPLSQDDLAGFLAVSRRTVVRTLEQWREEGLINTGRRSMLLKETARLRTIARHERSA